MSRVFVALVLLASAAAVIANVPGGSGPPSIEISAAAKPDKNTINLNATITAKGNKIDSVMFYALPETVGGKVVTATANSPDPSKVVTQLLKNVPRGQYRCFAVMAYGANTVTSNAVPATVNGEGLAQATPGTLEWLPGSPTVQGKNLNAEVQYKSTDNAWKKQSAPMFYLCPSTGPAIAKAAANPAATAWGMDFTGLAKGSYSAFALIALKKANNDLTYVSTPVRVRMVK